MKSWYKFVASNEVTKEGADVVELYIYDQIGESIMGGIGAKQFVDELKNYKNHAIDLFLNSPGGSVSEGVAIYNALARHKEDVTVAIEGHALSIASLIAMAGDTVLMAENGLMMIHDPWTSTSGNAADFRKAAEALDKVKEGMMSSYQQKTKVARDELSAMMSEETWMSAAEAQTLGFVDEISPALEMAASFDLSKFNYKHLPECSAIHRAKVLIAELDAS